LGTLLQGYLESSNVNIVEEMVNLIIAQRAFEFNTKGIIAADEMLGQTANLRR
jgi:flagellar basal-body rod protein FlgG